MKNFLQFIWNNQFTLLFLVLELVGFWFLTMNNPYHESTLATKSVAVSGKAAEINYAYQKYIGLGAVNNALVSENTALKALQIEADNPPKPNNNRFVLNSARVIQSTYKRGNNYLLIDKGSADGVKQQQGVLGPDGVVGFVYKVSKHYSAIMPIIHSQTLLSCKLSTTGHFGILKWDGKDERYAILEDIPNHVPISPDDKVLTRGASGALAADLLVGTPISSTRNESSGFQSIVVELASDFQRIEYVYLIENVVKADLDSLKLELENE